MPGSDLVQALARGLRILELVAAAEQGLTLAELAAALDLKSTTVHNLARTLLARRYLEKTPRPVRYRLGPAALEIAAVYRTRRLLEATAARLAELSRRYPEAVLVFCEPVAGEVMLALRASFERPGEVERPWARAMSPYGSATALTMQAFWQPDERAAFRRRHSFAEQAGRWPTLADLDAFLAEARAQGRLLLPAQGRDERLVGMPVFAGQGELIGALGARWPGPVDEDRWRTLTAELELAASGLGAGL